MIRLEPGEEHLIKSSGASFMTMSARQSKTQIYLKNVQFQLIAQALTKESMVLREVLPIYNHEGEEVYRLDHLFKVIQELKVFIVPCEDMVAEILQHTGCLATPELIRVKQLTAGLECFGYRDLEFPKSRRHLDFLSLDLKSIRVLNRLIADKVIAGMQT